MGKTKNTHIEIVQFGSRQYHQTVQLRLQVLREPLGLVFSDQDLAKDREDSHFAAIQKGDLSDVIVACLLMRRIDADVVQMRQVAVQSGLQKAGLGSSLARFAEEWASEQGFSEIILHARDVAVPFYKKLSYQIKGELFIEVGIAHYTMVKSLR